MTFNDQNIEKEIERYYLISQVINKYGKIFVILTLSFLYILFNNTDFNVFAFAGNKIKELSLVDIQKENINIKGIVFDKDNIDMINKSLALSGVEFKVIGSDITFKEDSNGDKEKFKKLSYHVGLVKTKDNVVLPINLSQNIENIYAINNSPKNEKHIAYHNLVSNDGLKTEGNKLKAKNKKPEKLESLYNKYNTNCMKDSILKISSYFCDKNVEDMMNNLQNHNMKKGDYRKLFTAFSKNIDNVTLCKKAVAIAEYQTNFENIEGMINLYCDEDTKSNFKMAEDVYRLAYTNTSSANISNDDVRKMYFMEKEKGIYQKKTVAIEDISNYLESIRSIVRHRPTMFKNDSIFSDKLAFFIGTELVKEIKPKLDSSETNIKKIEKTIFTILNGDEFDGSMLGLLAYTNVGIEDKLAINFKLQKHSSGIVSFKERITIYLLNNEKIFEKTNFSVDTKRKIAKVEGILKLVLVDSGKITNKNIRTALMLKMDEGENITVTQIKLGEKDLENYMKSLNLDIKGKSLKLIQNIYSKKLVYPIIYNNYGESIITACMNINGCKNNQINSTINGQTELASYNIKIVYTIDNDGKVTSMKIKDKKFSISDKDKTYNVDINLTSVEPKLNKIIKSGSIKYSDIGIIEEKIKNLIKNKVLSVLKKDELKISEINKLKYNFEKYLNIIPQNYKKSKEKNKALVSFTLNGINFNSLINIKNNSIEKLYIYKGKKDGNILIKNTNLKFSSAYDESLTLLKLDTLSYIKETDIQAYDKYIDKK